MAADQPCERVDDPVALLERWEGAGGTWRVLGWREHAVTISLCQCDGGTEADRFTSANPALARHLAGRSRSDDRPEIIESSRNCTT